MDRTNSNSEASLRLILGQVASELKRIADTLDMIALSKPQQVAPRVKRTHLFDDPIKEIGSGSFHPDDGVYIDERITRNEKPEGDK